MEDFGQRIAMICNAKAEKLISMFEDPVEIVEQSIVYAKKHYAECYRGAQSVLAVELGEKKKWQEYKEDMEHWSVAASNAVVNNDDEAAKACLVKKKELLNNMNQQEQILVVASKNAAVQTETLKKLKEEIEAMESQLGILKSSAIVAKSKRESQKLSGSDSMDKANKNFSRMQERINRELAEAEAGEQLTKVLDAGSEEEANLLEKYGNGAVSEVDDELAALKASLGK